MLRYSSWDLRENLSISSNRHTAHLIPGLRARASRRLPSETARLSDSRVFGLIGHLKVEGICRPAILIKVDKRQACSRAMVAPLIRGRAEGIECRESRFGCAVLLQTRTGDSTRFCQNRGFPPSRIVSRIVPSNRPPNRHL
ncbi:hypothetical protein BD311DRAFT_356650 [Dichomitus squalens]|uniref:Uncharacterized protein n=1 Tax=Dichomitus squalens TaxID=114155 RepID=A0A4Q9MP35_9APHY|nr:hypothetical protein BD311DRAFT_356650 [Dichomitus squalens]